MIQLKKDQDKNCFVANLIKPNLYLVLILSLFMSLFRLKIQRSRSFIHYLFIKIDVLAKKVGVS